MYRFFCLFVFICTAAFASDMCPPPNGDDLMKDLMTVQYWNERLNDRLPVTYNNFLQGGYINMPSARMGTEGELGVGYSHVHPYINYNLRCQLIDRLEVSGSYRIFKGVDDPILTPLGFGDMSDKGVNVKFSLFHPEDSDCRLPGLAIGFDDFIGTQNFRSKYAVLTQVFLDYNTEVSVGYGTDRLRRFFGGMNWMPWRKSGHPYIKGISFVAEYDATPYHDPKIEKHPRGRKSRTGWNGGFKYRLYENFDFTASYVRGHKWAFSVSSFYNFGSSKGFVPKIDDPLPYKAPVNVEPIGVVRPESALAQDLVYAFKEQGFDILSMWLCYDEDGDKQLRLSVYNTIFRSEKEVRNRLNHLLAYLIPSNIDMVIVTMESEGFPIQDYNFAMDFVRRFGGHDMCAHELRVLTPMTDATFPDPCTESLIYKTERDWFNIDFYPQTHSFFGSSRGKFKYALGVASLIDGFINNDIYYSAEFGYTVFSNLHHLSPVDRLNPSKLINVRTDIVNYYRQPGITVNEAYMMKVWNLGRGWYLKGATGYLDIAYAGLAGELLYYPVKGPWAIGLEGAIYRKRSYQGLGFTNKIRKVRNYIAHHVPFPYGSQYFLDIYYDYREAKIDMKLMLGKFLANDYGYRYEISRNFDSGMRLTLWYTYTNGNDHINGTVYHDKGVAISLPLDMFYTQTSRETWDYALAAWLRDVGAIAGTGKNLYYMINDQR